MTPLRTSTDMARFTKARDRGAFYLAGQVHADGSCGDSHRGVFDYYKVPCALQVVGYTDVAHRLCYWIRTHGIGLDGDFGPRPSTGDYAYAYFNSWVIIGAHRLGQFDLSQKGMDFLMDFWDAKSGGFYSSPTERQADTLQDLWVTSGCGQASLYTGRIDVALGVGRWMKTVMSAQPNYPEQLYSTYSRSQGLIIVPDPADEIRFVMQKDATRDQYFFHPGIAGGVLARLYQVTGQVDWLDLAREYMRFSEVAGDYLFRLPRSGKV